MNIDNVCCAVLVFIYSFILSSEKLYLLRLGVLNASGSAFLVVLRETCVPQHSRSPATCWSTISISFLCMSNEVHTRNKIRICSVRWHVGYSVLFQHTPSPWASVYTCYMVDFWLSHTFLVGIFLSEVCGMCTNNASFLKQIQCPVKIMNVLYLMCCKHDYS